MLGLDDSWLSGIVLWYLDTEVLAIAAAAL